MKKYKVQVVGYREIKPLTVEAENLQQASRKAKEELGLNFHQYFIEEDPKPS